MTRAPSKNGKVISTPEELFERHVQRGGGCWEWQGYRNENGYGFTRVGGRGSNGMFAHRLSWTIHRGPIPDGLQVLHRCDNPCCVRPDHLFLGTNQDNIDDRVAKGRPGSQAWKGKPSPNRKLSDAEFERIRQRIKAGEETSAVARDFEVTREHAWRIGTDRVRRIACAS